MIKEVGLDIKVPSPCVFCLCATCEAKCEVPCKANMACDEPVTRCHRFTGE